MEEPKLTEQQELIGKQILKENPCKSRFLAEVGLGLPVSESCDSDASGGEAQRNPSCDTDWFRTGRSCIYSG